MKYPLELTMTRVRPQKRFYVVWYYIYKYFMGRSSRGRPSKQANDVCERD